MSNWIYLEIAIGLVLVYFIVSLLCTSLTELIARWLSLRARNLKEGILKLLNDDPDMYKAVLDNPLFKGLTSKKSGKDHWWDKIPIFKTIFKKRDDGPSALPPATFSQIIFDNLITAGQSPEEAYKSLETNVKVDEKDIFEKGRSKTLFIEASKLIQNLEKNISSINAGDEVKRALNSFMATAKAKAVSWDEAVKEFRKSLETWFDDTMQRVTGWYKRKTQLIVLVLALIICFTLNLDSFGIARSLYNNPELRETVVAAAEAQVASNATAESANLTFNETLAKLDALNLPIGWNAEPGTPNANPETGWGWLLKIIGILVTALAASLGASFWFDLLKKFVNIRAAGKTPEKTEETKSGSK